MLWKLFCVSLVLDWYGVMVCLGKNVIFLFKYFKYFFFLPSRVFCLVCIMFKTASRWNYYIVQIAGLPSLATLLGTLDNLRATFEAFRVFWCGDYFFFSFKWTSCFTSLSRRMLFWQNNLSFCQNNLVILQIPAGSRRCLCLTGQSGGLLRVGGQGGEWWSMKLDI